MVKGQLSLTDLLRVMEDKASKKKFIAQHGSRQLSHTVEIAPNLSTIDHDNVYQTIQNIPISMGRRTLFFKSNKKNTQQASKSRQSRKARASLDFSQNSNPPSFSKGKRSKRYSLFSGTKQQSQTIVYESFMREVQTYTPNDSDGK